MASKSRPAPREGYTKRTLPMIPTTPALTRVPLALTSRNRLQSENTVHSTLAALKTYNGHLVFLHGLDADQRERLSSEVVQAMRELNRITEQAYADVQRQVKLFDAAVKAFGEYAMQRVIDLKDPSWGIIDYPVFSSSVKEMHVSGPSQLSEDREGHAGASCYVRESVKIRFSLQSG